MKKVISIILATAVALQLAVLPVMAKVSSKAEHSWRVVNGIGLANFSDSQKEEKVTRLEYAKFLANALGIVRDEEVVNVNSSLFEKAFYSNVEYDGFADDEIVDEQSLYVDVQSDDVAYKALKALNQLNIMTGDGSGYFHPEKNIKYEEVLKTFVVLASYNVDAKIPGSWPNGYVKLASDLDIILKGLAIGEEITKYQLCQILYNTFDVEMMKVIGVVEDKAVYETMDGVTFLNEMIGLYSFSGQLEATSNSSLTTAYSTKNSSLKINGIDYVNKTFLPIGSMLGRTVEAYRTEDGEVVYMTPIDEEEVLVIEAGSDPYLAGTKLYYQINDREKSIDVLDMPVIYNGVSAGVVGRVEVQELKDLIDIDCGTVTITKEADENVIIVWEYKDIFVDQINQNTLSLHDKFTNLILNLNEEDNTVYIFDKNMNRIDFSKIPEKTAASYIENGSYKEVYFGGNKITGKLENLNPDEREVSIDGDAYILTEAAVGIISTLSAGLEVTAYTNKFGKVFYIEAGKRVGEGGGVLAKIYYDEDETVNLKIYDETDKFVVYGCADKVTFTNEQNETFRITPDNVKNIIDEKNYVGYIVYAVNAAQKITRIQIPLESKSLLKNGDDENKVYKIPFEFWLRSSYRTDPAIASLGNEIFLNAETNIFSIPTDKTEYEKYDRFTMTSLNNLEILKGTAYYKNNGRPVPVSLVLKDHNVNASFSISNELQVVTKITETIRDDDRPCKEVVLEHPFNEVEVTVYDYYENGMTQFDNAECLTGETGNQIQVGDLVLYQTFPESKELKKIILIYSANMESPVGPDAKKGWMPGIGRIDKDGDSIPNEYTNKFLIFETEYQKWKNSIYKDMNILWYTDNSPNVSVTDMTRQNPCIYFDHGAMSADPVTWNYFNGRQIFLGYVYDYIDGYLRVTTQDLSYETYDKDATWKYNDTYIGINYEKTYNIVTTGSYLGVVEYYDNGVVARPGYPEDIYTYKKTLNDCSKMIRYGRYYVILNDYRTR